MILAWASPFNSQVDIRMYSSMVGNLGLNETLSGADPGGAETPYYI